MPYHFADLLNYHITKSRYMPKTYLFCVKPAAAGIYLLAQNGKKITAIRQVSPRIRRQITQAKEKNNNQRKNAKRK
jgi:hypothetical protein